MCESQGNKPHTYTDNKKDYNQDNTYDDFVRKFRKMLMISSVWLSVGSSWGADAPVGMMEEPDDASSVMTKKTGRTFASDIFGYEASEWDDERMEIGRPITSSQLLRAFERTALRKTLDGKQLGRLEKWAGEGHMIAKGMLGHTYLKHKMHPDQGVKLIEDIAQDLLEKAVDPGAEEGDHEAQLIVGLCYLWGHTEELDEEEGRAWLEPLAKSGNKVARIVLNANNGDSVLTRAEGGGGGGGGRLSGVSPATGISRHEEGGGAVLVPREAGVIQEERVPDEVITPYLLAVQGINGQNTQEWTPLQRAVDAGSARACLGLLQRGANVDQARNDGTTPLMIAAAKGHGEVCELLLAKGATVDQATNDGCTPLMIASATGQREVCQILLKSWASVDKADKNGRSPLYFAAQQGHREVCELLLAKGAALDKAMDNGWTPLYFAAQNGHREVCELLLAKGATVDQASDDGWTPLCVAAQNGHRAVCELLLARGAAVDKAQKDGWTPLCVAAQNGHREVCELLLEKGAAVDKAQKDGWTPLCVAAQNGHREVCKLLLAKGAAVDKANKDGCTPLYIAAYHGHRDVCELLLAKGAAVDQAMNDGCTPLMIAAQNGHREVCELLLARGGEPFKKSNSGTTPIGVAKTQEIRRLLWQTRVRVPDAMVASYLRARQDVNELDALGWTPLQRAAEKGDVEGCLGLIQRGAVVDKVDQVSRRTPLYVAAKEGHLAVCELLLEKGATVDQASDDGATPLHVAALRGHREVCELLLAKGADPLKTNNSWGNPIGVSKTQEIRQLLQRAADRQERK